MISTEISSIHVFRGFVQNWQTKWVITSCRSVAPLSQSERHLAVTSLYQTTCVYKQTHVAQSNMPDLYWQNKSTPFFSSLSFCFLLPFFLFLLPFSGKDDYSFFLFHILHPPSLNSLVSAAQKQKQPPISLTINNLSLNSMLQEQHNLCIGQIYNTHGCVLLYYSMHSH